MNVNINTAQFATHNVSWLDTKANVIMDGNFTKICYITPDFTMNGLYLQFPVEISTLDNIDDKLQMKFNPYSPSNSHTVKEYAKIENKLLDNYIQTRQKSLKKVILLSKQLHSGFMKIYKETYTNCTVQNEQTFCVKISGIWETFDACGLTYKLYGGTKF
jgi:hypothetical protein